MVSWSEGLAEPLEELSDAMLKGWFRAGRGVTIMAYCEIEPRGLEGAENV